MAKKINKKAQNIGNSSSGQSFEQYILKGPQHFEEKILEEYALTYDNQVKDFNKAYQCYAFYRNKGYEHALAWDKCGCHSLTLELQLQLRQKIKNIEKELDKQAKFDTEYSFSLFKESNNKKINNELIYSQSIFNNNLEYKIKKISHLIDKDIIHDVLLDLNNIYKINIKDGNINELPDEIKPLSIKEKNNTIEILAQKPHIPQKMIKQANSLSNKKISIIGFPSEARDKICEKLSSFYDIDLLNPFSLFEKAVKLGVFDEADFEQNKDSLLDMPSELVNFAYKALESHLKGFIIEGYPTTPEQLEAMDVDAIIFLDSDLKKMITLRTNRRWCSICERLYHLKINPPLKENNKGLICDRCGANLIIRPEDKLDYIKDQYYNWRTSYNDLLKELKKKDNFLFIKDQNDTEKIIVEIHRFIKRSQKK